MEARHTTRWPVRAFSLVELLLVVVIMGILAAMVVPQFAGATTDARTSATEATLAGVRSSIAAYRSRAIIEGRPPYPTIAQLLDGETVLSNGLPSNPITGASGAQSVSEASARSRAVSQPGVYGWNYFVDNDADPPVAIFYSNCDEATTATDGVGATLAANEL